MIDRDAIIQKLALEHRVIITKEDPIFIAALLHQSVLEGYEGIVTQKFLELQAGLESTNKQQFEHTKSLGEQLANKSVRALGLEGRAIQEQVVKAVDERIEVFKAETEKEKKVLSWYFWGSVGAAGVGVFCMAGTAILLSMM